jgi:transposase
MTRTQILDIYHAGAEAVIALVETLSARCEQLAALTAEQAATIAELTAQAKGLNDHLAKDSHNSSKPPSSDGPRKPVRKSLRTASGRSVGGQAGHPGTTLRLVEKPDAIIPHAVTQCQGCQRSLKNTPVEAIEKHQVFDLPPLRLIVTEHQGETKICPRCGTRNTATFPEEAQHLVQYGNRLKAFGVYLNNYQLVPYERTSELVSDLFSASDTPSPAVSVATLHHANQTCYEQLQAVEQKIKEQIVSAAVVNFDETALYCNGQRHWLHVASTPEWTAYSYHPKRGAEAMEAMNILPQFHGRAIHDYWKPYFTYSCDHGLCNGHHLRELTFIHEQDQQQWAGQMKTLLLDIKDTVEHVQRHAERLDDATLRKFERHYRRIIKTGHQENPSPVITNPMKKRGKPKQSPAKNLLDRFEKHPKEILAFMYDFNVPFDNNQGERDIRMMKVKQKISGCFRSAEGARYFCRIRGYISTARKQGVNVLDAIQSIFDGKPFIPASDG